MIFYVETSEKTIEAVNLDIAMAVLAMSEGTAMVTVESVDSITLKIDRASFGNPMRFNQIDGYDYDFVIVRNTENGGVTFTGTNALKETVNKGDLVLCHYKEDKYVIAYTDGECMTIKPGNPGEYVSKSKFGIRSEFYLKDENEIYSSVKISGIVSNPKIHVSTPFNTGRMLMMKYKNYGDDNYITRVIFTSSLADIVKYRNTATVKRCKYYVPLDDNGTYAPFDYPRLEAFKL